MIFKPYPKIRQFKNVVHDITHKSNFNGFTELGEPIYKENIKPTLTFKGTVKLHGTNAGICYSPTAGVLAQKRSSFISKDNLSAHFGFNQFVQVTKKKEIETLMSNLWDNYCEKEDQITLYGEWAGKGVQKSVAISNLDKSFYFFDCKVYNDVTKEEKWIDISNIHLNVPNIFNIHSFETFEQEIDFNNPQLVQNTLADITLAVEKECPVSKHFEESGIGEGVVWTCYHEDEKYIFKVKGQKHSTSKVKQIASVNPQEIANIIEFVEYACTPNRIEQGIKELKITTKQQTPDLLRWVSNDIISEETDVLIKNNLEWKQVARQCNEKARNHLFSILDKV